MKQAKKIHGARTLTLTREETQAWDDGEQPSDAYRRAQEMADASGHTIELLTDDDVVVEVFYPRRPDDETED